jgi:hypothetical protein
MGCRRLAESGTEQQYRDEKKHVPEELHLIS